MKITKDHLLMLDRAEQAARDIGDHGLAKNLYGLAVSLGGEMARNGVTELTVTAEPASKAKGLSLSEGVLSEGTLAAIANLVDYTIEQEYGHDVSDSVTGARVVALAGLQLDLREPFIEMSGSDRGLPGYAETTLRILLRDGLTARTCQCRTLHQTCPHKIAGMPFCTSHYEADVPPVNGALLCGDCYNAEYDRKAKEGNGDTAGANRPG